MKRISDEKFIESKPAEDNVIGIRIKDGNLYFIAHMEAAENYCVKQAISSDGYCMDKNILYTTDRIFDVIEATESYNLMYVYERKEREENYQRFLNLLKCYEKDGSSDVADHDIFVLTTKEFVHIFDALRDGDYIFVIED